MTTELTPTPRRRRFNTIPGISDRGGLPRLGKIRLGLRIEGKGYPMEVKHFIFDPSEELPDMMRAEILERCLAAYGELPMELRDVMFVAAPAWETFSENFEWWGGGRMLCHGDGSEADRMDRETGIWSPRADCVNSRRCAEWATGKQCKMIARLRFLLPAVDLRGYWQLDTGSHFSAGNIRDGLNMLQALHRGIDGIPVTLLRAPKAIVYQGTPKTHHLVYLFPQTHVYHAAIAGMFRTPMPVLSNASETTTSPAQIAGIVADALVIPEIDVPEDLVATPPERVIDEEIYAEAEVMKAELVPDAVKIVRYKTDGNAYTFRTSDNTDHRTRSKSVFESVKVAKAKGLPITLVEEAGDDGALEVLHVEVLYA